jgi:hypothetical protein
MRTSVSVRNRKKPIGLQAKNRMGLGFRYQQPVCISILESSPFLGHSASPAFIDKAFIMNTLRAIHQSLGSGSPPALSQSWTRRSRQPARIASGGEGACLLILDDCSHLPLRGKLGWMTPRAGVKTTPASVTRLRGLPVPSGAPIFLIR